MKNGFTMIELLAVIMILGVIALIITPVVVNYISTTKSTAYLINIDKLLNASKIYYQNYKLENNTNAIGESYDEILKIAKGEKPDNGVIYFNGKGDIALSVKYKDYCYVKNFYSEEVIIEKEDVCSVPFDYMMKAEENASETSNFLNGPMKRNEIESIKTLNYIDVVDSIGEWDVSEKQNGTVMAWYKDEDGDNLYEVYIGSNDIVRLNTDSSNLFSDLVKLNKLDIINLSTTDANDMSYMFSGTYNIENLDLSSFDTSNVTNMKSMFGHSAKMNLKDIKGLDSFDTSNVTNMSEMFMNCFYLEYLDLSSFDTSNVTNMHNIFRICKNLKKIDLSSWNTSKVTNMQTMFFGCRSLTSLDLSNFDTSNVISMAGMFSYYENDVDTYGNTYYMRLEEIKGIEDFDTSNVTTMLIMFQGCLNLKNLDLSKWNTSKVTNMTNMFFYCRSLTSLDLSNFDTGKVTDMGGMFAWCSNLTELDVSSFDTSNVINMGGGIVQGVYTDGMFQSCSSLTNLDLSNFDTSKVISISGMFYQCVNLETLNIRNAVFNGVLDSDNFMFEYDNKLAKIIIKNDDAVEAFINSELSTSGLSNITLVERYNA